ncbi:MAG: NAD(P)-dependent oxidoreductase [Planctomycetota bacterium]
MVILVTGATGFLGGAVARRLALDGSVLATGRRPERGRALVEGGVSFLAAELSDPRQVAALFAGGRVHVVLHCAALSAPWGRRAAFEAANVDATRNLVEAALGSQVARFVHVSTPAVYFDGRDRHDVREDAPLPRPRNHYARTKLAAERVIDAAVQRGLPAITLRPRALFGPGDTTIFPRLLRAMEHGRLPILGSGTNRIDLTYIDNAVKALELALAAPEDFVGRTYNITDGAPLALWPLLQRLAAELGFKPPTRRVSRRAAHALAGGLELLYRGLGLAREPLLTRYTVGLLSADTTLDISAARGDLGYEPEVGFEAGLARFLAWWKAGAR